MNRKDMEAIIASGASVLVRGQIISRVQDLPSAAELAAGDPSKEASEAAALTERIAALEAELVKLQPEQKAAK